MIMQPFPPKQALLSPGPISFTTLQRARRQNEMEDLTKATGDADIFEAMKSAAIWLEQHCGQNFTDLPYTDYFWGETGATNPTLYLEGRPILAVTAVLNGDGSAIPSTDYVALPKAGTPKTDIQLTATHYWVGPSPAVAVAYAQDAIKVTGNYGFHRNYTQAWKRLPLTATVANATNTTITLSSAASALIDVGNILRLGGLGTSEQVLVTGPIATGTQLSNIIASATAITVDRGINLTTAAAQAAVVIDVWQPDPIIELAARMLAASMFVARHQATGEVMSAVGFGPISTSDVPKKVKDKLVLPVWNWMFGQI
jgi:hypothetical protein